MTKESYPLVSANALRHDLDSPITGHGKHSRVFVFFDPQSKIVGGRVDLVDGLRMPTEKEVRAIARRDGWLTGHTVLEEDGRFLQRIDGIVVIERVWLRFRKRAANN